MYRQIFMIVYERFSGNIHSCTYYLRIQIPFFPNFVLLNPSIFILFSNSIFHAQNNFIRTIFSNSEQCYRLSFNTFSIVIVCYCHLLLLLLHLYFLKPFCQKSLTKNDLFHTCAVDNYLNFCFVLFLIFMVVIFCKILNFL